MKIETKCLHEGNKPKMENQELCQYIKAQLILMNPQIR